MSDLSTLPTTNSVSKTLLVCFVAASVLVGLAMKLSGGSPDALHLSTLVAFCAFGLLVQSAYSAIFLMEPSFASRMSHAVGFSLWVSSMLLVLWWFDGSYFAEGMLVLLGLAAALIPVSFFTFSAKVNSEALTDRSTFSRGTPMMDDYRWIATALVFAGAVWYAFAVADQPNPLMLAFWALFASALLAPTLDVEQPRWILRARDLLTVAMGGVCVYAILTVPA